MPFKRVWLKIVLNIMSILICNVLFSVRGICFVFVCFESVNDNVGEEID